MAAGGLVDYIHRMWRESAQIAPPTTENGMRQHQTHKNCGTLGKRRRMRQEMEKQRRRRRDFFEKMTPNNAEIPAKMDSVYRTMASVYKKTGQCL
eukprot:gene14953-biopygen18667